MNTQQNVSIEALALDYSPSQPVAKAYGFEIHVVNNNVIEVKGEGR
jgi:hypothetical protein